MPFDEFGNYKKREPTPIVQFELDPTHPDDEDPPRTVPEVDLDADYEVDLHIFKDADLKKGFHIASNLNYVVHDTETIATADKTVDSDDDTVVTTNAAPARELSEQPFDYEKYRPYFRHVPQEKVMKTFQNTTQWALNVMSGIKIVQTIKSPFVTVMVLNPA